MRNAMKIARIAGIDLKVHWTFAFLIVYIVAIEANGGWPAVVGGLVFVAALFGSVIVHELAHSLVAKRLGLQVRDIVLLPIGGASEMEDLGASPTVELQVAIVGPLTSFALAAVILAVAGLAGAHVWPPSLTGYGFAVSIGWLNAALGVFNMLPALPLDGGRVFRAAFARVRGEPSATEAASKVAAGLAVVMIAAGLLTPDIILSVIGVFVFLGSRAELQRARGRARLAGLRVGHVLIPDTRTLDAALGAAYVAPYVWYEHHGFPVVHEGRYIGMVGRNELAAAPQGAALGGIADRNCAVLDVATPVFPDAIAALTASRRESLAVVAAGRFVGVFMGVGAGTFAGAVPANGYAPA